jgi:putative FmdB family regulatory protein
MPIYEYGCKSCGKVVEVIQQFSDRPLRKCRTCSGRLEKLISRTAFQLKGGGWYAQGYTGGGSKKSDSGSTASNGSSDSGSSSPAKDTSSSDS